MPIHNPAVVVGIKSIATGSYAGNDADNRQITTGFKCSMAVVESVRGGGLLRIAIPNMTVDDTGASKTDCLLHAVDGFEVDKIQENAVGTTYYYWAISE